jgi:hypothetical protein
MDRHFFGLKRSLSFGQLAPRERAKNFAFPKRLTGFGKLVRRAKLALHGWRVVCRDAKFLQSFATLGLNLVPADSVALAIAIDVVLRGMQREMRGGECDVRKEWLPRMLGGVLLQALDRVIGDGRRRVVFLVFIAGSGLSSSECCCGVKSRLWSSRT